MCVNLFATVAASVAGTSCQCGYIRCAMVPPSNVPTAPRSGHTPKWTSGHATKRKQSISITLHFIYIHMDMCRCRPQHFAVAPIQFGARITTTITSGTKISSANGNTGAQWKSCKMFGSASWNAAIRLANRWARKGSRSDERRWGIGNALSAMDGHQLNHITSIPYRRNFPFKCSVSRYSTIACDV